MNQLEQLSESANSFQDYAQGYFNYLSEIFQKIDLSQLESFVNCLQEARANNKTIYFIGNGGSAATASHFVNDLAVGTKLGEQGYKAISFTDNNALLTAIGNDFGYEDIFVKQLEPHLNEGDVVVAISASGNSPNIVKAIKFAASKNCTTVGISGFSGGELHELSKIKVHVPSNKGEYGPVEDLHMIFDHLICSYLMLNKS